MNTPLNLASIEAGLQQLSALVLAYSLSAVGAVLLLIAGYVVAGMAERWLFSGLAHFHRLDLTIRRFLSKVVRYAILLLTVVMVLGQFGVQTASIVAALGAIGLAIGLALQGTLQNIAAGIMLLVLRPLRIGEYVEVGEVNGTVEEIGLFATRLRTLDGIYTLAPNATLWNQPVRNLSRNGVRRNDVTVGIGYDDDIDLAQRTLVELAKADSRIFDDPPPMAFVAALGDSTVSVTLRYWTKPEDYLKARLDLTKLAKLTFDSKGISIPIPQQEVIYRPVASH